MTRLGMAGAEIDISTGPDAVSTPIGTVTRDTTVKRTGAASWKCNAGVSNLEASITPLSGVGANGTYYLRGYYRFPASPAAAVSIMSVVGLLNNAQNPEVELQTNGTARLLVANTLQTGASANICDSNWHRIELKVTIASNLATVAELRVDGTSIATWTGSQALGFNVPALGFAAGAGANFIANIDDVAMNDATTPTVGSGNNSWCGAGAVVLMKPTSDSQRGSWTGGAGGTTNLFNAIDNTPPIGTAAETDLTQIESIDGSGDNATDEYRGNCGTYTTAGAAATDKIAAIQAWVNHGEDVATNTKTGRIGLQSNPSNAGNTTFTFGNDVTALGTYPTNWAWTGEGTADIANNPLVVLGSSLIINLRKSDTGTRVASVDFFGAYVDIAPQPQYDLDSYRWRNDDGFEATATWRQAVNTPDTVALNTPIRLRVAIEETNSGEPPNQAYPLEYRFKPSGGSFGSWFTINAIGAGLDRVYLNSGGSSVADDDSTTRQIWPSATKFEAGRIWTDTGGTHLRDYSESFQSENEYAIVIDSTGGAAAGDTYEFRVSTGGIALTTSTNVPSLTIPSAAVPPPKPNVILQAIKRAVNW